jgi:hypothetical protein
MTEENKSLIDLSEYKDWQSHKVTKVIYDGLLEHKEDLEDALLNMNTQLANSEKIYWETRGKLHVLNYFLEYIDGFPNPDIEITEEVKND